MYVTLYILSYLFTGVDINKIIENSKLVGKTEIIESDISMEIIRVAKLIYEENKTMHPWFRGIDMIDKLKDLGKSSVRSHLEKLGDKGTLESKLHGTKKVYRLKVIEDE